MDDDVTDHAQAEKAHTEKKREEKTERALEDTFPASDPPASSGSTGPGGDTKPHET